MTRKFLTFKELIDDAYGTHFAVNNHKKQFLGYVYWDKKWKKWIFEPDEGTFFAAGCLQEIVDMMNKLGGDKLGLKRQK